MLWKNLGEMFDDLNQRFHTEVTIDRKDEQWKDREKNCREIISEKAVKRCHLKTWWNACEKVVNFIHENTVKMPRRYREFQDIQI